MELLSSPASPFVRKVRALLAATGYSDAVTVTTVSALAVGPTDDLLASHNPAGKIPALVRAEGPTLYDSRVITRYLDALWGLDAYPEGRLWDVLTLEASADAILDAAVSIVYEARFRPEELRSEEWVEGQWRKVSRMLDALEARWLSHLHGPLDMALIAVGCACGYLDFRHSERQWRTGRPGLAAWWEDFAQRDFMQVTAPSD